jgi:hypothetical protein
MENLIPEKIGMKDRKGERGAALVMVMLISFLLLVVVAGLLLEAAMNTANVTDAIAEQQAYDAAESGVQSAISVLRGNTVPNPLIDPSKPASHQNNKIDFAKAIKLSTSNNPGDLSTEARLSRWVTYNYTPSGVANPDRVSVGSGTYAPSNGLAYSVSVRDPDNPLKIIALTTTGSIGGGGSSKTFGVPFVNAATITYNSVTTGNVDVSTSSAGINLGSFTITKSGAFASSDLAISDTPFEITVKMTAPLVATVILRGTIKGGNIKTTSVGNVKLEFDSPISNLLGSIITVPTSITPNAPNVNGGKTDLSVTITLSQPKRLVIRSVGYGPRGARKILEAIVQRDVFDGLIPATITLVGNTVGSIFKTGTTSLQQATYSGADVLSAGKIPPIGTTGGSGGLLSTVLSSLSCLGCNVDGNPADVTPELPSWLKSTAEMDKNVTDLKSFAQSSGRYFTGGATPPDFGDNANGTGVTFIDGDANLTGAGGGILVVTGKLNLDSTFDFNGTIIVTGAQGVRRVGNGFGNLQGNLVVAPYDASNLAAGFSSPKYDISGGAVSNIIYKTSGLLFGSNRINTVLVGVAEK